LNILVLLALNKKGMMPLTEEDFRDGALCCPRCRVQRQATEKRAFFSALVPSCRTETAQRAVPARLIIRQRHNPE
jgi:hypothetical protein